MHAYVTCRPDIGYAIITLSKFSSEPSDFHFSMLKKVAFYLRRTRKWSVICHKATRDPTLPGIEHEFVNADNTLPKFPDINKGFKLTGFVDAAYGTDLKNRQPITGH